MPNKRSIDWEKELFFLDLGKEKGILCTLCEKIIHKRDTQKLQSHHNTHHNDLSFRTKKAKT